MFEPLVRDEAPLPAQKPFDSLGVSPDGRWLAATAGDTLLVWHAETHEVCWTSTSDRRPLDVGFSLDGESLFVLYVGAVGRWRSGTGEWLGHWEDRRRAQGERLVFDASRERILVHLHDSVVLLDAHTLNEIARWGRWSRVRDVDLHPTGSFVAAVVGDDEQQQALVFRVGVPTPVFRGAHLEQLRFAADGRRLLTGAMSECAVLQKDETGVRHVRSRWPAFCQFVSWPGGALMLTRMGTTRRLTEAADEVVWESANFEPPHRVAVCPRKAVYYSLHEHWLGRRSLEDGALLSVVAAEQSPATDIGLIHGDRFIGCDRAGRIQVWDLRTWDRLSMADPNDSPVHEGLPHRSLGEPTAVLVVEDTLWVCTRYAALGGAPDRVVGWRAWHNIDREPDVEVDLGGTVVSRTGNGRLLVLAKGDVGYRVCSLPDGVVHGRTAATAVHGQVFSNPDASLLFVEKSGGLGFSVEAWDTVAGASLGTLEASEFVRITHVDDMGVWLDCGKREDFVVRWDPRTRDVEEVLTPDACRALDVKGALELTFLEDGLVVREASWHASVVDLATGACLFELGLHNRVVCQSGDRLVTCGEAGQFRVWSLSERRCLRVFGSGPHGHWWSREGAE